VENRRLIIALSCALAMSLFLVAFLLGRESMRARSPTAIPVAAEPPPFVAQAPIAPPPIAPPPIAPPPAAPPPPVVAPERTPVARPASLPPAPGEGHDAVEKQAVARYFREADELQESDVENPEAQANSLVSAATEGDTSGLRALVKKARDAEAKAAALTVPPACAHYHRQLIHVLQESREMLQRLEQGLSGGDVSALPSLLGQANAAKARLEALTREERTIKSRFGLVR
jgi:hypothetical protein